MVMDVGDDFAFLGVRIGGDGEGWPANGLFCGDSRGLGGWCAKGRDGGRINKGDGGGGELALCEDGGGSGGHVVVV